MKGWVTNIICFSKKKAVSFFTHAAIHVDATVRSLAPVLVVDTEAFRRLTGEHAQKDSVGHDRLESVEIPTGV